MPATFLLHMSMSALVVGPGPGTAPSRRALCTAAAAAASLSLGSHPLAASAAASIEKGAPAFGTAESRTGLLDGIRSAFSEKTGDELAAEYAQNPADVSGVAAALPSACATARNVAIIFHGSGGPDRETADVLARFRAQDVAAGLERELLVFNWLPWFTSNTDRRRSSVAGFLTYGCRIVHIWLQARSHTDAGFLSRAAASARLSASPSPPTGLCARCTLSVLLRGRLPRTRAAAPTCNHSPPTVLVCILAMGMPRPMREAALLPVATSGLLPVATSLLLPVATSVPLRVVTSGPRCALHWPTHLPRGKGRASSRAAAHSSSEGTRYAAPIHWPTRAIAHLLDCSRQSFMCNVNHLFANDLGHVLCHLRTRMPAWPTIGLFDYAVQATSVCFLPAYFFGPPKPYSLPCLPARTLRSTT